MTDALLEMRGICKTFPGVRALVNVNFSVRAGEVHALVGENGAGKSTLMKVLTGVYQRDAGSVVFRGAPIAPRSPRQAEACGISCVYQEVNLIPHLSVAENIMLGRQPRRFGMLDWRAMRRNAERALSRLGISIDVTQDLSACSVAIQQMVAIARALDIDANLLILDEPTSSLDEKEVEELFAVIANLRTQGFGIVFITHFLEQIYKISDRITVLRNGELVGTHALAELPRLHLVAKMLGKDVSEVEQLGRTTAVQARRGETVVEAQAIGRRGVVGPIDVVIHAGETVGLAGLLGSGRTETARMLFGIDAADAGEIRLNGVPTHLASPRTAIAHGIAFCSEDRKTEGIIPNMSVRENITLALQAAHGVFRRLGRAEQVRIADTFIAAIGIKTPSVDTPITSLSGGNQQKVLLARWLAMQPRLIILDEPTRGIDVGAKAEIEKLVGTLCSDGMAVLFISSELEEVVRNCHRVAVLRDRRKLGEFDGNAVSEHAIMQMIAKPHD